MATNRKQLFWLHGEVKSPPFTDEGRYETGMLLRLLQEGVSLGMPQSRPLPSVGPRCHELRIRDGAHNWRLVYRIDEKFIVIGCIFAKQSKSQQQREFENAKQRFARHDQG